MTSYHIFLQIHHTRNRSINFIVNLTTLTIKYTKDAITNYVMFNSSHFILLLQEVALKLDKFKEILVYCCWWTVTINYNRFAFIIHQTSFFMFTIIFIYSLKEFVLHIVSPTINCHKIGHKTWYFAFQQCNIPRYYINGMCIGLIFLCHHWNKCS